MKSFRFENKILFIIALFAVNTVIAQSFSGKTQWPNAIEISSVVSSSINQVLVKEGQLVAKGENLILMDNSAVSFEYKIALSRLAALTPNKNLADMDLNRAFELHDRDLLSDVSLKNAEFKFATIKAEYDLAQASLDKAKFYLNSTSISSPIDGRVLTINKTVGFFSDNQHAESLITLVNEDVMHAIGYLKVSQWNYSLVGKKATVTVMKKQFNGVVESLSLSPIENSKGISVYPIIVRFQPKQLIPSGMPLTVNIK